jgi:hypothetical protein
VKSGVSAQAVEVVGILVAAGDRQNARQQDLGEPYDGLASEHADRGSQPRAAIPIRRAASASNMTPPSDDNRPPSKAAVSFLPRAAKNENCRWRSCAATATCER